MALATFEAGLRTEASLLELEPDEEGGVALVIESRIVGEDGPLAFERDGERLLWVPPAELAGRLDDAARDATADDGAQLRRRAHHVDPPRDGVPAAHGHRDAPRARRRAGDAGAHVPRAHAAAGRRGQGEPASPGSGPSASPRRAAGFTARGRARA